MAERLKIMKLWLNVCVLSLVLATFILTPVAQGPTYDEVKAKFAGTTFAQWRAAGYQKAPVCLDGSVAGHPELGGMGFLAPNFSLMRDHVIDPLQPEMLLLDSEDQVVGVSYMVTSREEGCPELFGHPFVPIPANEANPRDYYALNVWFVGAPEDRFEYFNPAVTCPAGTTYVARTGPVSQGLSQGAAFLIVTLLLVLITGAALRASKRTRPKEGISVPTLGRRLMSIDALRGFDMFWIAGGEGIIHALRRITNVGLVRVLDIQLAHRDWEGATFYDLIFPLFVFIVGVSLVFSLGRFVEKKGKAAACKRIFVRSIFLFVIGVIFSTGPVTTFEDIRLLGVLQRIAICYLVAGLLFCTLKPRGLAIVGVGLLVGYWALMTFVPVLGVGAGNFQEGTNLANYIDQQYLPLRKWDGDHDPEGLLSTLPAIVTCLVGVFAGLLLKNDAVPDQKKVRLLLLSGVAGILLGFLWGVQFPVIKKIWTSSYVLVTGGWSCILLAVFYHVIEIWGFRKWAAPFVWIGMNSITIYLVSGFLFFLLFFVVGPIGEVFGAYADLVTSLAFVGLILTIAYALYRRKIFLRV